MKPSRQPLKECSPGQEQKYYRQMLRSIDSIEMVLLGKLGSTQL
jgi:hypothetical protein